MTNTMKKFTSLLVILVLIVSCFSCLAACDKPEPEPPHECKNICPECGKCLDADCTDDVCADKCEGHEQKPYVADNTEHFDDVTKSLKLTKAYDGKSFLNDGIGSATLSALTDGDTTRFLTAQGDTVIVRYYCVDTPESTGGVEKWGKAASLFVKERLSAATEIVLEATSAPASHDSYGTRWLGYVWYKTAEYNEFKNLNLELVENGYSDNKGMNTGDYPYYKYFKQANDFAKSIKLRLYSSLDDPLFNNNPVEMTIKEFNDNPEAFYDMDNDVGSKVVFTAYLTSLKISASQTYTFTAEQYDPETGKTHSISVYAAYSSSPASTMKLGHLYHIVGNIQNYYGKYQVSGIVYDTMYQIETQTYVSQRNYYLMFNSSLNYSSEHYSACLYNDLTVTSASVEGTTLTIVGTTHQRTASGEKDAELTFTVNVTVPEGYNNTFAAGDKISFNGYQLEYNSGIITVYNVNNIVKK